MSDPTTLGSLLGIEKKDIEKMFSLDAKDDPGSVTGSLGVAAGPVAELAAEKLNGALDVDCLELLGQAWAQLNTLREYADPGKHPPGEPAVMRLGSHRITHKCFPLAELKEAGLGTTLARLQLTLELTAAFTGVALSIREGKIMDATPGEASVEAALKYKSFEIVRRKTPSWKLPGRIPFGDGIAIPA